MDPTANHNRPEQLYATQHSSQLNARIAGSGKFLLPSILQKAEDFAKKSKDVTDNLNKLTGSTVISKYLETQWFQCAEMWADFGRRVFHQNSETNNQLERFFYSMKYQFLRGYPNKRVDELLLILHEKVIKHYRHLEELHRAKRIPDAGLSLSASAEEAADRMIKNGLCSKAVFQSPGRCV
ncbi:hypothetical protein SRHO_G00112710 [Serrasalmus rhombeus]